MANWYSTDWWHRLPLTIPHGQFSGDVALTLPISGLNLPDHFWSKVKADGTDIVVASSDGVTKLKRQIAYINTATRVLEVYVQWPSLSASVDTPAWLYYGNPDAAETDDADTWPDTWVGAYCMADYDLGGGVMGIRDFSQYGNHGTKGAGAAAPTEVAGVVGMAQSLDSANAQYIECAVALGLTEYSIVALAMYTEPAASATRYGLLSLGATAPNFGAWATPIYQGLNYYRGFTDGWSEDAYHCAIYTGDMGDITKAALTVDGTARGATVTVSTGSSNVQDRIRIGKNAAQIWGWHGPVCEAWIYAGILSADEKAAIDAALRGTATFYSVGAYEHRPLYIMQGYRRMTDGAIAEPQTYRRVTEKVAYQAQGYRRLALPAEYIMQSYRRVVDKSIYIMATKRRLRTLYRILGRPSYAMDHHPKPDYGLGPSGRANDRHR